MVIKCVDEISFLTYENGNTFENNQIFSLQKQVMLWRKFPWHKS